MILTAFHNHPEVAALACLGWLAGVLLILLFADAAFRDPHPANPEATPIAGDDEAEHGGTDR